LAKYLFFTKLKQKIHARFFSTRLKFTTLGKYFAVLSFFIGAAAVNAGINLLFVVFAMMLSTLLVSGYLLESTTKKIRIERHLPNKIHAGEEFEVSLTITNDKKRMPSFSLVFQDILKGQAEFPLTYALKISPRSSIKLKYKYKFEKRGRYSFPHTMIISRFPFGFFVKYYEYPCKSEVIVYPEVRKINQKGSLLSKFASSRSRKEMLKEGSDIFHGIREFRPGDNPKWVHWRSSAKFQKIMLKEYEIEDLKKVMIILDTFIPKKENELLNYLEEGIILTASLANYFRELGCEVSFVAYTPKLTVIDPGKGIKNLDKIYLSLALLEPSGKYKVESIFTEIDRSLLKDSFNISIFLKEDQKKMKNIHAFARDNKLSSMIFIDEGKHHKLYSRQRLPIKSI
jgi:uncharacterized protein (DUF58 family)